MTTPLFLLRCVQLGISIRDLLTIFENLADHAVTTRDTDVLTEYVRQGLKRAISSKYFPANETTRASSRLASNFATLGFPLLPRRAFRNPAYRFPKSWTRSNWVCCIIKNCSLPCIESALRRSQTRRACRRNASSSDPTTRPRRGGSWFPLALLHQSCIYRRAVTAAEGYGFL